MAIIFVSPRKRQRIFTWSATAALLSFLFITSLLIFPPQIKDDSSSIAYQGVFSIPNIKIDFNTINSPKVKSLELFETVQAEFDYAAEDEAGKKVGGKVLAFSLGDAKDILSQMNLKVLTLSKSNTGRNEPFIPYYRPPAK